jgi:hypothetical protein
MAEVEFRTGPREIPDHLADMMQGIETQRMTYEEAVDAANRKLTQTHVDKTVDRIIKAHFTQGLVR